GRSRAHVGRGRRRRDGRSGGGRRDRERRHHPGALAGALGQPPSSSRQVDAEAHRRATMKVSTQLAYAGDIETSAKQAQALERAGLDLVWVAEAYSFDAPSIMGYLAARTERVQIGAGILPIYTRTPTLLAMTAAGIDALSGGRCVLGLGASGPQVIEG